MVEIKLPKCLTEKEANLIRDYNDLILSKLPEEKRARMIPRFLASVDCPQRGPRYSPFKSIDDVETNTECFNKKLYMGLLDAYEANTYDNSLPTPEVVLMLFNGAYAMSIHALNHKNPELYYEKDYRNIWWTGKVDAELGNEIDVHMEHICACMIYRILEAENNPRYDVLLRKIKNLIKGSYFVEADTLDLFKHTIVSATPLTPTTEDTPIHNTQTEQKTTEEENRESLFCNVIQYKDPQALLKRLHQLIDGKKGADVGCVLLKCKQDGYIIRNPKRSEFVSEFALKGTWQAIHKYMEGDTENALDRANKVVIFE